MLIINWIVPGTPRYSLAHYFELECFEPTTPIEEHYLKMMWHFLKGPNDKFRAQRFKFIPCLAEGPWAVKRIVGKNPALIGRKLTTTFHKGEDYLEICIDVGSSSAAAVILGACKGAAKSLVIDMGFTIEGRKEDELPERLLACMRLNNFDLPRLDSKDDPITGLPLNKDTEYES